MFVDPWGLSPEQLNRQDEWSNLVAARDYAQALGIRVHWIKNENGMAYAFFTYGTTRQLMSGQLVNDRMMMSSSSIRAWHSYAQGNNASVAVLTPAPTPTASPQPPPQVNRYVPKGPVAQQSNQQHRLITRDYGWGTVTGSGLQYQAAWHGAYAYIGAANIRFNTPFVDVGTGIKAASARAGFVSQPHYTFIGAGADFASVNATVGIPIPFTGRRISVTGTARAGVEYGLHVGSSWGFSFKFFGVSFGLD